MEKPSVAPCPLPEPGFAQHEVQLWCANVGDFSSELASLQASLAPDELARAGAYRFAVDKVRYVTARGLLRRLLGHYLGLPAAALQFRYGPQGRPALCALRHPRAPHFNLSHSDEMIVYAVSERHELLGVDVERSRALPDMLDISARFFSKRESATLAALPSGEQQDAFFRCWTRKEAAVKALGTGLSHPLDNFDVTLVAGAPAQLHWHAAPAPALAAWTLHGFEPAAGYIAALAVGAPHPTFACRNLAALRSMRGAGRLHQSSLAG
ncbi:4'-phosphopantetheinyl transferase family protein [Massilia sp. TWP1-3-3]|uniref:4'-phosphopantetheinyl transferase family protein n=1 Tax=Massilia sp. TWP1-3-3 TaxID=2804573 RepID=UPI003CEEBBF7